MRSALAAWCVLAGIAFASPAQAALNVCNRTSYVLYAAGGYTLGADSITQGWTRIAPGSCEIALAGDLKRPPYYLYAKSSDVHRGPARFWGGKVNLCLRANDFTLNTAPSGQCPRAQDEKRPFAMIAVKGESDTTTLTEDRTFSSDAEAANAGLQRLLADNGYDVGGAEAPFGVQSAAALEAFKTAHRLAHAGTAELMKALEKAASLAASPDGLSVCNDGGEDLWAAMAAKEGERYVSRGWWKITPKTCGKLITDVLSGDYVYLAVMRAGGAPFLSGPAHFCVADINFEIQGRENCTQRGLTSAGFFAISAMSRRGFTAHVNAHGLAAATNPK